MSSICSSLKMNVSMTNSDRFFMKLFCNANFYVTSYATISYSENVVFNVDRSLQCNDSIRYAEGVVVNASNTSDSEWVKELFNCNLTFVKRLKEITMDTTEFSILNAVVLTYPGKLKWARSCLMGKRLVKT